MQKLTKNLIKMIKNISELNTFIYSNISSNLDKPKFHKVEELCNKICA